MSITFIPYFASPPPVQTGTPNIYGSVYKRPDGHCLIVMANFNGATVTVRMSLNAKYFPTVSKVESWTAAPVATVAPVNGSYQVPLPGPRNERGPNPRTYKLLHVVPGLSWRQTAKPSSADVQIMFSRFGGGCT
jgi:hypothetical protein